MGSWDKSIWHQLFLQFPNSTNSGIYSYEWRVKYQTWKPIYLHPTAIRWKMFLKEVKVLAITP